MLNVLICGLGGQGVVTLAKTILRLCERRGIRTQSFIFKGSAQRLGSVFAELRLYADPECSSRIPAGAVDVQLALDPGEVRPGVGRTIVNPDNHALGLLAAREGLLPFEPSEFEEEFHVA